MNNNWAGIYALTLSIISVMIAQFVPTGVLTPMAFDLDVSVGYVGQSVTLTSIFAFAMSLLNAFITKSFDRKKVLLFFSF